MDTCCFNCKQLEKNDFGSCYAECLKHGVGLFENTSKIVSCMDFEEGS